MNLSEKTIEICSELSSLKGNILDPMTFDTGGVFSGKITFYGGFKQKKRFSLFRDPPLFKLHEQNGKPILTSLSREYDSQIEAIAKKNDFAYSFENPHKFTAYF